MSNDSKDLTAVNPNPLSNPASAPVEPTAINEQIEGHSAPNPILTVEKSGPEQYPPGLPDARDDRSPPQAPHNSSAGDGATEATSVAIPEKHSSPAPSSSLVPTASTESDEKTGEEKTAVAVQFDKYPFKLSRTHDGTAYAVFKRGKKNAIAMPIDGNRFFSFLANFIYDQEGELNPFKVRETIQQMALYASHYGELVHVWNRIAPIAGGIEIALFDEADTRVRITAKGVEILKQGSDTIFNKRPISQALPIPSHTPNLNLLHKYLNVDPVHRVLLIAWVTYTLCSPKCKGSKYVFLVIQGEQGSGKSLICRFLQLLIDPSSLELQAFPANAKDLSIILSQCHLAVFDNVRSFSSAISDLLCTAATGGLISGRALYSNDTLHVLLLHGAIIFNSIHGFVVQSDLAQRCLTIRTATIDGAERKAESKLLEQFERDLPHIFAGLLELSSQIMANLPLAKVTHPERMIEFCQWISAMELALGLPKGSVQAEYSNILNESQLDTLLDNALASAVIKFISEQHDGRWSGTPTLLLLELEEGKSPRSLYGRDWPQNPIQLSKRLNALKASLETQGIRVTLSRGKRRQIELTSVGNLDTSEIY